MIAPTTRTVCIVDDDAQVRRLLVEMLDSVGLAAIEFSSGEDFMRHWQTGLAECILLDVRMPRITGPEVHDWLRQQTPEVPVIFLTGYADVPTAVRAMRLGAFDFIEKPFNVQHLIERVNDALRQAESRALKAVSPQLVPAGNWRHTLTPREEDILQGILSGKRNKVIAADLGISERTVETHRASIMSKANARTAGELVSLSMGQR